MCHERTPRLSSADVSMAAARSGELPLQWYSRILLLTGRPMPTLLVNGKEQQLDVPDDMPLLWALRDVVGLTGTKFGCGVAVCGACTVHLDGRPIRSCITPVSAAAGQKITTIEAVGSNRVGKA